MRLKKDEFSVLFEPENTSGQGKSAVIPPEIRGWNWGASLLGWIWAVGNKRYNVAVYGLAIYMLSFLLGPVGWAAELAIDILLGVKGNEWAWQSNKWKSIEHFRKTQKTWLKWGILISVLELIIMVWVGITEIGMWHI